MKTNPKATNKDTTARLAGGYGPYVPKQDAEALLRRSVMACLLWEKLFYESGSSVADQIAKLVPQVDPATCAYIAIECRNKQKMRHAPLWIAVCMAHHLPHRKYLGNLLPKIVLRADELAEFLSLYWKDGKCPLAKQVKVGLAEAFKNFDEYQLAKWRGEEDQIKLRDVLFLTHPKPQSASGNTRKDRKEGKYDPNGELFKKLAENTLATPDTWEVALSTGKNKRETWTRLIDEHKLGALAFVRNLRNMEQDGVPDDVIRKGFETVSTRWLVPLNAYTASKEAPRWTKELEALMLKSLAKAEKLPGLTIFVVDVSGSMTATISEKSSQTRMDVAAAMAMLAYETCEKVRLYVTAGNDSTRVHKTQLINPRRGFSMSNDIIHTRQFMNGGGIFTRQCLEYIKTQEAFQPDRIIIFSDSQDCDRPGSGDPKPFGKRNYIVDVSAHDHGVNYAGLWTAEVSGWSEYFIEYIRALEGVATESPDEEPTQQ